MLLRNEDIPHLRLRILTHTFDKVCQFMPKLPVVFHKPFLNG